MIWYNNLYLNNWAGRWFGIWGSSSLATCIGYSAYSQGSSTVIVPFSPDYRYSETPPIEGTPTEVNQRYVGNDYDGSHIVLSTGPVLHNETWLFSFRCNFLNTLSTDTILYGEGNSITNNPLYAFGGGTGVGFEKKLRFYYRDENGVELINATTTIDIFDGIDKLVTLYKNTSGEVYIDVNDGETIELIGTLATSSYGQAENSVIGALISTSVIDIKMGIIWDINKNGEYIPLDEGTGTDIYNAEGTLVGNLVDPLGAYWNYYVEVPYAPQLGQISGTTNIGYRDKYSNTFINTYNSVYTDGSTEVSVDYVETSGTFSPVVDGVLHSAVNNEYMDSGVMSDFNYATEFEDTYYINIPTIPTSTTLIMQFIKGSAKLYMQVYNTGRLFAAAIDNSGVSLFTIFPAGSIVTGNIIKIKLECIDTVGGTPGNFDFILYVDGVKKGQALDINLSNGLTLNRLLTGGGANAGDFIWYEWRSTISGLWIFDGTLKENGDTTQGQFENVVTSKILSLNKDSGLYPNVGSNYYLDREGFNV